MCNLNSEVKIRIPTLFAVNLDESHRINVIGITRKQAWNTLTHAGLGEHITLGINKLFLTYGK